MMKLLVLTCILVTYSTTSFAACSNNESGEAGEEGQVEFFTADKIFKYCNGTNWINMTSSVIYQTAGNGLVGHWSLDETTGSTASDSTASGNTLNMQGGMTPAANTVTGKIQSGFQFDGSGEYLENTSPTGLPNGDDAFTISAWVNSYTLNDRDGIVGWGQQVTGRASILTIEPPTGHLRYTTHGSGYDWDSSATLVAGQWHHVAVTHEDNSKDVKFYLDGQYIDTATNVNAININQNILQIGNGPTSNILLDGELDDVRIYNYALTAEAVETLATCRQDGEKFYNFTADSMQFCGDITNAYNMGDPGSGSGGCAGASEGSLRYNDTYQFYEFCDGNGWVQVPDSLIMDWKFDEVSGSSLIDSRNNTSATFTGDLITVPGVDGRAIMFDGSSYADISNFTPPQPQGTIAFWMNLDPSANLGSQRYRVLGSEDAFETGFNDNASSVFSNQLGAVGGSITPANTALSKNQWYHMALTYDLDTTAQKVYVNGTLTNTGNNADDPVASNTLFSIGRRAGLASEFWYGYLDDVKIYSKVLSDTQVQDLYNSYGAPPCEDPTRSMGLDQSESPTTSFLNVEPATDPITIKTVLTLPDPIEDSIVFETGGTGQGLIIWIESNNINVAAGDGSTTTTNNDGIVFSSDISSYAGDTIDIIVGLDPSTGEGAIYVNNCHVASEGTTGLGVLQAGEWAGTDDAGYGLVNGTVNVNGNGVPNFSATSGTLISDIQFFKDEVPENFPNDHEGGVASDRVGGLIAYWDFEEGSGINFSDSATNYDGSFTAGTPTWVTGHVGSTAVRFDSSGERAEVATAPNLSGQSFTVMGWAQRTATGASSENILLAIGAASDNQALLFGWNNNNITCGFWNDDLDGNTAITDTTTWYHIACSYNAATNEQTVYLNGNNDGSRTTSDDMLGTGKITIGNRHFGSSKPGYSVIDEVRIYNRALSASEIQTIYDSY